MKKTSYDDTSDFYSRKNIAFIPYRNDQELKLMVMFEADSNITGYEMFMLPIMDSKTGQPKEEAIGFTVYRGASISYVLLSDYLTDNSQYADRIKKMICESKGYGEVTTLRQSGISGNLDVSRIK
jgi:hypothetical protein